MKRNSQKVGWPVLKALNDLYLNNKTSARIQANDYVLYLMNQLNILTQKKGNNQVLIALDGFREFYEANLQEQYIHYYDFLEQAGITPDARKTFTEEDIRTLMMIFESRHELKGKISNIEDFSAKVFDYGGSKYLKSRLSVQNAVLKILGITEFPQSAKDMQYRLVVDYTCPEAIILCENKSFLKQPWNAKNLKVKLWHVGGNNISILDDIDEMELQYPMYYSCDWDLEGLRIYGRIKTKLEVRGAALKLLIPPTPYKSLPVDSFHHKSQWLLGKSFSGLEPDNFNNREITLIKQLIGQNRWIEEESNILADMLKYTINQPT